MKHLKELIEAKERGYNAVILIMALRRCNYFLPNWETDRAFSEMFYRALEKGVDFKGFRIKLGEDGKVYLKSPLKLAVLR
ncbi:MAG TPA: hypothetical protein EYP47_00490 [Methanococcaceae archaeon]|nr:hypothetical protein [Methanococcaceae archaeon]